VLQSPKAAVETTMPDATASCVDLNVLTAMIGNDPANVDDVLRNFRKSAALSSVELTDAAIAGSGPEMSDVAHKLKSAARSIGALHLGELCAQIEAAADNGESQNLETLLTRFLSESADVFRYLDTRFATASVQ
jgi:HPt (histidine-containing phosphotransfer) domain-containing protein